MLTYSTSNQSEDRDGPLSRRSVSSSVAHLKTEFQLRHYRSPFLQLLLRRRHSSRNKSLVGVGDRFCQLVDSGSELSSPRLRANIWDFAAHTRGCGSCGRTSSLRACGFISVPYIRHRKSLVFQKHALLRICNRRVREQSSATLYIAHVARRLSGGT